MTTAAPIRSFSVMLKLTRRHRDHYLHDLAAEPLLRAVPRHLIPVVARSIDVLRLAPGATAACEPLRETIIVTDGQALLEDCDHRPVAIIGPGRAVGYGAQSSSATGQRITAITELHCFVIARRDLQRLLAIAPGIAEAIAHATAVTPIRSQRAPATDAGTLTEPVRARP
jgi:hypothetical protein